ncbi:hypothetical protein F6X42_39575 [Paraburkholderia sp. WC7.3b]|uniref:Uncharacterized protein n=1 Tax=Paraburkholderia podalyriae TaxID=1938811 RepID=A0ABR7Q1A3_9BURK|nr:hypothetical protein [Paraburkholderia podalyriae]
MRSLHANQACLPSSVRCSVLLHFGDPHEGSVFKGLSQRLHSMSLRRMARDYRRGDERPLCPTGRFIMRIQPVDATH